LRHQFCGGPLGRLFHCREQVDRRRKLDPGEARSIELGVDGFFLFLVQSAIEIGRQQQGIGSGRSAFTIQGCGNPGDKPRAAPWIIVRILAEKSQTSLVSRENSKTASPKSAKYWSGRRESNPRMQLGKLPFCH
jgi:hypothetical protein